MDFGGPDLCKKEFTHQKFTKDYVDYVRSVQNMPQKPTVLLVVPVFTCNNISPKPLPGLKDTKCGSGYNGRINLQRTIYDIAE